VKVLALPTKSFTFIDFFQPRLRLMNRVVRPFALSSLSLLALVSFIGCAGYQLGSVKPSVYQDIQRIHVPTFENATLEPRVSSIVTNAVIKELQKDGTYQISNKASADAVLRGKIRRIERRQLRSAQDDTLRTTEMSLFIIIEWALIDPSTGQKLDYSEARLGDQTARDASSQLRVRPGRVIGRTIQFIDPNFQLSERNAIPIAAEDAAQALVSQLTDGW
jgi:hypothetical protein